MKTLDLANFNDLLLSDEEMINVRGGYAAVSSYMDNPIPKPPVVIIQF